MQMALDKTSECDDQGAWESMIMGLLHHAEPLPTLLFLCGCFVKHLASSGDYWQALLSCHFLSTKPDGAKFQYLSAQHRVSHFSHVCIPMWGSSGAARRVWVQGVLVLCLFTAPCSECVPCDGLVTCPGFASTSNPLYDLCKEVFKHQPFEARAK